jgi:hypothetical protein
MSHDKPKLYIHVGRATHFLKWELPEFKKYFTIVDNPSKDVILLSFGPDILQEAERLPALKRFAVLFPGFGRNPVYNLNLRAKQIALLSNFDQVFINPGPLEIAYTGLDNITFYPFSVDINFIKMKKYRTGIDSLIHISNDGAQKDWPRSEAVMKLTGLKYEVYPPREKKVYDHQESFNNFKNTVRGLLRLKKKKYLPYGYVSHSAILKKYQEYDGFVHIASDVKHPALLDGKYTASLIEAGVTGAILFWHDTFELGNGLKTVFNLPADPQKAAEEILRIRKSLDVEKHSRLTRQEMIEKFNPEVSVRIRAEKILSLLK